jgi:hypothetical protein
MASYMPEKKDIGKPAMQFETVWLSTSENL